MVDHAPRRPSWDCSACGSAWPCNAAREQLGRTFLRTTLAITLSDFMREAALDMPAAPPAELHDRFLGWIRQPPRTQ